MCPMCRNYQNLINNFFKNKKLSVLLNSAIKKLQTLSHDIKSM